MSKSQAEGDNRSFQTGGARINSFRLDTDIRSMQMGHPRQNCVEIMCRACEVYRICGAVCVYVCRDAEMDAGRLARQDAAAVQEESVGGGVDGCRLVGLKAR